MDNLENKADEFAKKMEDAANDGWNTVESGADKVGDAANEAKDTAAEVAKDAWNKVEEAPKVVEGAASDAWTTGAASVTDAVVQKADVPAIDAWKKIDEDARKLEEKMNAAADEGWNKTEDAAQTAEKAVDQAAGEVLTPAAEVAEASMWKAETPVEPETPVKSEDTWTAPVFTPTPVTSPAQPLPLGSEGVVPPVIPSSTPKKFPTWAIILIVLLVLCICGGLGISIVTSIFKRAVNGAMLFLPYLM